MRQLYECGNYKFKCFCFNKLSPLLHCSASKTCLLNRKHIYPDINDIHVGESPLCKKVQQSSDVSLDVSSSPPQRVGAVAGSSAVALLLVWCAASSSARPAGQGPSGLKKWMASSSEPSVSLIPHATKERAISSGVRACHALAIHSICISMGGDAGLPPLVVGRSADAMKASYCAWKVNNFDRPTSWGTKNRT